MSTPITEFLLARIADIEWLLSLPEFEEDSDSARSPGWGNRGGECFICGAYQSSGDEASTEEAWFEHAETVHQRSRVLAECAAKRAIIEDYRPLALRHLAAVYSDHPDYQPEWRP